MTKEILIYIGGGLTALWGITHLIFTKGVVDGFGEINQDNKRIITMEWIVEGVTLIFIGVLVSSVTMVTSSMNGARVVYLTSGITLIVLALVSVFTGFRVNFVPFKLCPLIFTLSAVLIFIGGYL